MVVIIIIRDKAFDIEQSQPIKAKTKDILTEAIFDIQVWQKS